MLNCLILYSPPILKVETACNWSPIKAFSSANAGSDVGLNSALEKS